MSFQNILKLNSRRGEDLLLTIFWKCFNFKGMGTEKMSKGLRNVYIFKFSIFVILGVQITL